MSKEVYEVTEKKERRFCDECEKGASHQCKMCYKDLCGWMANGHAIKDPYDSGGDYPNYFCKKCLEIGKPFRKIIDECQEKEDKAFEDCNKKCKEQKIITYKT